jgi:hypothetical protein
LGYTETEAAGTGTHLNMDTQSHEQPTDFPPLAKIAAALFEITETLAREVSAPTDQLPPWGDFEWRIARAVAAMHGVSTLLCACLRWKGPESWRRFLEEQRDHVSGRHRKIELLLDRIDSHARSEGIALVALKGAELHRRGIYRAGERPMADVDLLVRETDENATTRLLKDCGYALTCTKRRERIFESGLTGLPNVARLGEHVDSPIKIELHTGIREPLPVSEADITQFVFPSRAHVGLNGYPSAASLMMHLLLHAAGNMRANALRLIQLHDIARLATRFSPSDWEELLRSRPGDQGLWWALSPLVLAVRYCRAAVPPSVIARLGEECPWLLRWVSRRQCLGEVSWSNLRVYAFPGIEWSRTPLEALRYMISRIWPSRETRLELERFAVHYPGAAGVPWYGISQGARMLRWAFSKPPRVQALLPVRAALAQRYDDAARGDPAES